MKLYVVISASSGLDRLDYTPQSNCEGVYKSKDEALEQLNKCLENYKSEQTNQEIESFNDGYILTDLDDDYCIEIKMEEVEIDL